ncbi:MAG TPA: hypothetical protein VH415_06320 [Nitrososphaeraceae archaeon]|jgi:hypothetical protein
MIISKPAIQIQNLNESNQQTEQQGKQQLSPRESIITELGSNICKSNGTSYNSDAIEGININKAKAITNFTNPKVKGLFTY